jgi:hypothetical protein
MLSLGKDGKHGREPYMAWKLVEIPPAEPDPADLSDVEVVTIYLALLHRMKGPYDDTNPEFTCYLKLTELFKGGAPARGAAHR